MTLSHDDSAARYRRLIEQSQVGLFQSRIDGRIEWLNAAAAKVAGYDTPESFLAAIHDIRQIYVDPSRRDELLDLLRRHGAVSGFEYEVNRPDGTRRWLSVSATAIRDDNGSLEGFEGSFVDVTTKKLLEAATSAMTSDLEPSEAVARFSDVLRAAVPFQQLSLLVIQGDHYRRLVSLAGGPSDAPLPAGEWVPLAGNSVEGVVRTGAPVVVQDTSAGEWPFDDRLRQAGIGSYVILPLVDASGVFATFNVGARDTGAFTDEVVDLLRAHSAAVTQAVKNILVHEAQREVVARLEEIDRLKNEFFATVAHDLKNPLSLVAGMAEMLEERWPELSEHHRNEMLGALRRAAVRLQDLIQRDLDVALIESGELRYESHRFDLAQLVRDAVGTFEQSETRRAFVVDAADDLPQAIGDAERQSQILFNLISNAVKFSPEGSRVAVSIVPTDDSLNVGVSDEGPGIAPSDVPRVFLRGARLDPQKPGLGLGLFIVKSMVEAQGGRVWVEGAPGGGACFKYTVPLAPR